MNNIFERFIDFLTKETTRSILCCIFYITFVLTIIKSDWSILMQLVIMIPQFIIITIFCSVYLTLWLNQMSTKIEKISTSIWNETKKVAKEILLFFVFLIISSNILSYFITGSPENQISIENNFNSMPIINLVLIVIIGPALEEFVFRYLPYQFIANKKMYILVSAIIFASMHVVDDPNAFYYVWAYMFNALYFGYRYYKTKDLLVTFSIHSFNNLLSILPLIALHF